MSRPRPVLFLCTGNSARSIIAESILNVEGAPDFVAYSAGSKPKGRVHQAALNRLQLEGHPVSALRSKSWNEFGGEGGVDIDFVITVCDNAANEACPLWPGHPASAHWGIPDPDGSYSSANEEARAFLVAYKRLEVRIRAFIELPFDRLSAESIASSLATIGAMSD